MVMNKKNKYPIRSHALERIEKEIQQVFLVDGKDGIAGRAEYRIDRKWRIVGIVSKRQSIL